ncbi:MAG TPA: DNA repair protein RecN, partial [Pseudobdellovibrionaceae bacterium]|nr:DNA repair protein RecN [Pseudobdellovibrionaceae bacterium]
HQQETLESRLSSLRKLQKKYGQTTQDILCALVQIETELSSIANSSTEIDRLKKLTVKTELELKRMAESLHESRRNHSSKLAKAVNNELADLNMKGVIFSIEIAKGVELGSMGLDSVEFMIQSGSKDQVRSLAKFASGGELSRVLLSLKKVIGKSTMPRTYLFDEVDAGVSGETAQKVGRKLHAIAEGQQVVCITHLPQVAAFGDVHFYISKSTQKGNARMDVRELTNQDRIEEIARLISGEKITRTSLDHAKNLLELRT